MENRRRHIRFQKPLVMQYCLTEDFPKKWDISMVDNMSLGGMKFAASNKQSLQDKVIHLQIHIPELAPRILELRAFVLSVQPRWNSNKSNDVRVKFLNVSSLDKDNLSLLQDIVKVYEENEKRTPGR